MADEQRPLTRKQRAFVAEYVKDWNGTQAAIRAGYSKRTANEQAARLLANVSIRAEVDRCLPSIDEIAGTLAAQMRGDMGEFLAIGSMGFEIDLNSANDKGLTKLIRKVKQRTTTSTRENGDGTEVTEIEIELYDAQAAAVHLGKWRKMFVDRREISGPENGPIQIKAVDYRQSAAALAPMDDDE